MAIIVAVLITSVALLFRWLSMDSYSLEIDPDEVYRIIWSSFLRTGIHEVTERDEIEEIVRHLNAWRLINRTPHRGDIGSETPDMSIGFYDENGNRKLYVSVRETGHIRLAGIWHQIIWDWAPVTRFSERFG